MAEKVFLFDGPQIAHLRASDGKAERALVRAASEYFADTGGRELSSPTAQTDRPGFWLIEPKLMPPRVHPGMLRRARLLEMLDDERGAANGALRDATHSYTASQIMFAALGFCGLIFSILLLRADRREGGRLERAK